MRVAERLKILREKAGFTQTDLSEKSGLPVATIRDIEQGKRLPAWPTLRRLSIGLGVSVGAWDDLEDEESPRKTKVSSKARSNGHGRAIRRRV